MELYEAIRLINNQNKGKIIKLENYPWTIDDYVVSYYASFSETLKVLNESKSGIIVDNINVLKNSYLITLSTIDELLFESKHYIDFISSRDFYFERNKKIDDKFDFKIMKLIYFSLSSIMTLVDHARNVNKNLNIENYDIKIKECFDEKLHKFFQDFRNYVIHKNHKKPEWLIEYVEKEKKISLNVKSNELLKEFSNWSEISKQFLNRQGEYLDIKGLFKKYKLNLENFYSWYFKEIECKYNIEINRYYNYMKEIKIKEKESIWELSLQQIKTKRNFYSFLNQKLELSQIKLILKLNNKPEEQLTLLKKYFCFIDVKLEEQIKILLNYKD